MDNTIFTGVRAQWQPLYEALRRMAAERLGEFEERQTSSALLWRHASTFAEASARKDGLVVALAAEALHAEWKPFKTLQTASNRVVHYFTVTDEAELPALVDRIAHAYGLTQAGRPAKALAEKVEITNVDEYIAQFPPKTREILERIRQVIRGAAPDAVEKISWQMPTYWQGENLIHFAAAKTHVGLYPGESGVSAFAGRLPHLKSSKGAIQLPLSEPMPFDLIAEITRFRVAEAAARQAAGKAKKP